MTRTYIGKGKSKATADSSDVNGAHCLPALTPPRIPPRRSLLSVSIPKNTGTIRNERLVAPSSSILPKTSSSKRMSQSCITSFFPVKKQRIQKIPFKLGATERKVEHLTKNEEEYDIEAFIEYIEKEEQEEKKADIEAQRQLKREEKLSKEKSNKRRKDWSEWRRRNSDLKATFEPPVSYSRDSYRNVKESLKEFDLKKELDCLPHCLVPRNEEWGRELSPERWYRLDDLDRLMGRKEAVMAGIQDSDEENMIAEGWKLFIRKQTARNKAKASPAHGV